MNGKAYKQLRLSNWPIAIVLNLALGFGTNVALADGAATYSLDGVTLSAPLKNVIVKRGKAQRQDGNTYIWENAAGGTTNVTTLANGIVVEVDVKGGPREVRNVSLPAMAPQTFAVLGQSGHINYNPPAHSIQSDLCVELGLGGKPCESFTLPGWGDLVVNFGTDVGLADGSLNEIILAAPGYLDAPKSTLTPRPRQTFPGVAPSTLTNVNVTLTVSGCGVQAMRKGPISISVWPANWYPGDGDEVARAQTRHNAAFQLQPGYYRFMLGGSGCWEEMQWLVLLPEYDRSATLSFKSFDAKPGTDYDVYYISHGALGGTIPSGVTSIALRPISDSKSKPPTILLERGLYYADFVPEGSYILEAKGFGRVARKTVYVKKDEMEVVNFAETDFPR